MKPETVDTFIGRIEAIEAEVGLLQATMEGEGLAPSERQYLARCFDLLHIELAAVRSYIAALE